MAISIPFKDCFAPCQPILLIVNATPKLHPRNGMWKSLRSSNFVDRWGPWGLWLRTFPASFTLCCASVAYRQRATRQLRGGSARLCHSELMSSNQVGKNIWKNVRTPLLWRDMDLQFLEVLHFAHLAWFGTEFLMLLYKVLLFDSPSHVNVK